MNSIYIANFLQKCWNGDEIKEEQLQEVFFENNRYFQLLLVRKDHH